MISKEKMVAVGGRVWVRIENWATRVRKDFRLLISFLALPHPTFRYWDSILDNGKLSLML